MITRIVRMTFIPEKVNTFLAVFERSKHLIAGSEGCLHLELHRQADQPDVFYTISRWRAETDLENYRQSELFKTTWSQTKILFREKPMAWTLEGIYDSAVNE